MSDQAPKRRGNPHWVKGGPSPNPKGRPRTGTSLAEAIRRKVDPDELIDLALAIARGQGVRVTDGADGAAVSIAMPTAKDQLAAMNYLSKYAYEAAPKTIKSETTRPALDASRLTDDELEQYRALLLKAAGE